MFTKRLAKQWRDRLAPQQRQVQAQYEQILAQMNFIAGGLQMTEFILGGVRPAKERPEPPRDPAGAQAKDEPPPPMPPGRQPPDKGAKGVDDREAAGGASPAVDSTAADRDRP